VTGFHSTFTDGTAGYRYRILSSPSPTQGTWTELTNFIYIAPAVINDGTGTPETRRFYRAVQP
jgi:hypothetical protein